MAYTGRRVFVGLTSNYYPVLLYGVEGRSPSSRSRVAVVHGKRVAIEPVGELTPDQKQQAPRLVYDAIIVNDGTTDYSGTFGVIGNGKQTMDIASRYRRQAGIRNLFSVPGDHSLLVVGQSLKRWGHEGKVGDKYNTPRIAGLVDLFGDIDRSPHYVLGIVTAERSFPDGILQTLPDAGMGHYLTTYTGAGSEPEAPVFCDIEDIVEEQIIEGATVQQLAEEMYGSMDPEFVVCAAAALWSPSKSRWELAVKNKI